MIGERIFTLWGESCALFKREQLKMFLLAWLQNVRLFMKTAWPMFLGIVFGSSLITYYGKVSFADLLWSCNPNIGFSAYRIYGCFDFQRGIFILSYLFFLFILFVYTRPSVERKDIRYFKNSLMYYPYFLLTTCFLWVFPSNLFIGFFLLDFFSGLSGVLKAIVRGLLILLYCLPVVVVINLIKFILLNGSFLVGNFISYYQMNIPFLDFFIVDLIPNTIFWLVMLFVVALHCVFYVRIKHTQHQFFF